MFQSFGFPDELDYNASLYLCFMYYDLSRRCRERELWYGEAVKNFWPKHDVSKTLHAGTF